jgi:hypothetical protein
MHFKHVSSTLCIKQIKFFQCSVTALGMKVQLYTFLTWHYMDVTGQLEAPSALSPVIISLPFTKKK